jgi:hypothetical protein
MQDTAFRVQDGLACDPVTTQVLVVLVTDLGKGSGPLEPLSGQVEAALGAGRQFAARSAFGGGAYPGWSRR